MFHPDVDGDNIELAWFSMHGQNREATSGKTSVCLFVNNMSNIKEVSRYRSPEVEYLTINCRPHYLPREFSSVLFGTVSLTPQNEAGTKTALNQLYKAISKDENAPMIRSEAGDKVMVDWTKLGRGPQDKT